MRYSRAKPQEENEPDLVYNVYTFYLSPFCDAMKLKCVHESSFCSLLCGRRVVCDNCAERVCMIGANTLKK